MALPDGNGRSGRMIMTFLSLQKGYLPPVIPVTEKAKYLRLLRDENDIDLGSWLFELSELEWPRFIGFRGY